MIEVTQNQNVAFAPSVPQSVQMLSAVVHDKTQPDETRRKAARLLIPHLRLERDRLLWERVMARTGTLREREHEREVIGWT
jgi:hypothetical protein